MRVIVNEPHISTLESVVLETFQKGTGILLPIERNKNFSWPIERIFFISNQSEEVRGKHAHKSCKQFFVCVSGSVTVLCTDGQNEKKFILDGLGNALYVPSGIWVTLNMKSNSAIAVITDQEYDESDYIRDWPSFLKFKTTI